MRFQCVDTIFAHPDRPLAADKQHLRFATNRDLYFFRIVKERYSRLNSRVECSELSTEYVRQPSTLDSGLKDGGGERDRTDDLLLAKQALSQLSYTP